MHPSLRLSTNAPALALFTVLFTATPASVHAQTPTPTPSDSTDGPGSIAVWPFVLVSCGIVVLALLCLCCAACWESGARRPRVQDVERRPAASSCPTQGQGQNDAAPAPPPQAHTKENAGAANEPEQEGELAPPPPYYPVSYFSCFSKERRCSRPSSSFATCDIGSTFHLAQCPPALQRAATMRSQITMMTGSIQSGERALGGTKAVECRIHNENRKF
ncbi:hypothetical protein EV363DRAFT_1150632 [Boletus edulis]|nr:hypothetical protein EV363DRAFT_1150632 [Boletus edulis]